MAAAAEMEAADREEKRRQRDVNHDMFCVVGQEIQERRW